ncbi:MAG: helix-turn-helix domain-containing protein [Treponema sp.]|jgi:transcriptional regulator with XRE-family HTH domain|nr:helix-turn-helix domain-containing protein [Treponema sp.]
MQEDINRRLVEIRVALKKKQGEFAREMGIKQGTWSDIEAGKNPVSDRYIRLVCLAFKISERWLRTGEGEMLDDEATLSAEDAELIRLFHLLSLRARPLLIEYTQKLIADEQVLRGEAPH